MFGIAYEPGRHPVRVLVNDGLAGVRRIEVVVRRLRALRENAHDDEARHAVGSSHVKGVVRYRLRNGHDGVVPFAPASEIIVLEVAGLLRKAQVVEVIVGGVDDIEQIGHRGRLELSRVGRARALGRREIENLPGAVRPPVPGVRELLRIGLFVAVRVEPGIGVVARGHYAVGRNPARGEIDQLAAAGERRYFPDAGLPCRVGQAAAQQQPAVLSVDQDFV